MDPKEPFKICLYPSVKSYSNENQEAMGNEPDEMDQLILHNYLMLKRNCLND